MARRASTKQSKHDNAVRAAKTIYENQGMYAWINPGSEKNKSWVGFYIDVIAVKNQSDNDAWIIEVETDESVSETEAKNQWKIYDGEYASWFLAVPKGTEGEAKALLKKHGISNCKVITWKKESDGSHTFWGLPGLG